MRTILGGLTLALVLIGGVSAASAPSGGVGYTNGWVPPNTSNPFRTVRRGRQSSTKAKTSSTSPKKKKRTRLKASSPNALFSNSLNAQLGLSNVPDVRYSGSNPSAR
jgi:hypothetical protein